MFKKVAYIGFEGQWDLHALAERATEILGGVIRSWRDEVEAVWRPARPESGAILELTLTLALWNASGTATGAIRRRDFNAGEDGWLRSNLLDVWLDLLGLLSRQQMQRLAEMVLEPQEA